MSKNTPKAAEKAAEKFVEIPKEIVLPSGRILIKTEFKGKHVREAQRLMDGDISKYTFAIMSVASLIDGKKITLEEIDEMDGNDVLFMMSEFESLFS